MLYPENLEQKIGFDHIRQLLKQHCLSSMGTSFVDKIRFSDDAPLLQRLLGQTQEFGRILASGEAFPSSNYLPIDKQLDKARLEGAYLQEEELHSFRLSLQTILACLRFFKGREEEYPLLTELGLNIWLDPRLLLEIEQVLDDSGRLKDNASPELQRIRRSMNAELSRARRTLDSILRSAVSAGYAEEGASLTIRNGRLVIPIPAEHKRRIRGFVQDESATGQTVFLEPAEVLEINNTVRELELEEKREIIRILSQVTSSIRPHVGALRKAAGFLAMIDFIRAKAMLGRQLGAIAPELQARPLVAWEQAVHPLLLLSHRAQNKPVVPLNISLTAENRILIISGPNAGGKSVALKTLGLLQYMLQCGLPVPMAEGSTVGIFRNIFIDIGDEQSLENDLSTYSSHLTNMRFFLRAVDKRTLFLIDEFGTGTEPRLGGAIAEAILEDLLRQGGYGVINTHYGNLKQMADRSKGLINGAMRFDVRQLEPMYQLDIGRPGSSFALEIARKIGLPTPVLEKAKELAGSEQVELDKLLVQLEEEKKHYQDQNRLLEKKEKQLRQSMAEYTELREFLDNKRNEYIREAKLEARKLLDDANKRIEATIRDIRENKAEKESTRASRQQLEEVRREVRFTPAERQAAVPANERLPVEQGPIQAGDAVRIKDQGSVGEVVAIRGKDVQISMGALTSTVKLDRLEKISRKAYKKEMAATTTTAPMRGIDINERMANFSSNLDVRGLRTDEAIARVDSMLDSAAMLGTPELRIIHGKGDGILRQMIRNHLKGFSFVTGFEDEHVERGGPGVTLVYLQ
ncbi:endonuclease MutS2 [Cesiribacter andamanensis]|uniref:Endonuclease MutS2 n=1 Tax=Cesiribacter andamanensis AMV16 TaxID=1279009 RepID=M7N5W7_9BACT|nr:Smr/MutS family protein [Cesiribacter andamanensis]EMR02677.1 MutS2 protein [Cesiribacter andamanensis AMV16]